MLNDQPSCELAERRQRAITVAKVLDEIYPQVKPTLDFINPFTLLVATLLSAQCTDKKVNAVTPILFTRASTPQQMAELGQEAIMPIIASLGLAPTKSRNIAALSRKLCEDFGGEVPQTFEGLESLPGVGHKTASVVMALAFGIPAFPVDTHIKRLAQRWKLSASSDVSKIEADLKELFPPEEWYRRHLQLIYFGREYCPARNHAPAECPICSLLINA
ncbi:endonuclease III [bacterium]|nr:endonuclease III [bacterium]